MDVQKTTHFGFEKISVQDKAKRVGAVFHSVASKYDLMNDLMSFGLHRVWKQMALARSGVKLGNTVLDLAGGTGDLTGSLSKLVGPSGTVILGDINASMLSVGRTKLLNQGYACIQYAQLDAETLPFPNHSFDCVTIAFGLRNVTNKNRALASIAKVLKPGGRTVILEFSHPKPGLLKTLYDHYSFSLLPKIGKFIAKDEESYQYLAESIRTHPDQEQLKSRMQDAGFEECDYQNLLGGIVAIHIGYIF